MPDTKISGLTAGDPALSTDEIPAARSGTNVKITAQSIADLASGGTPSDFQPAIVTGNYYTAPMIDGSTSLFPGANVMYAVPFWTSHAETWTRIGIYVASGDGDVRLGIYQNGANNLPGTLLLDAGTLDTTPTGEIEVTISQALSANTLYWLVYLAESDPEVWSSNYQTVFFFNQFVCGFSNVNQFFSGFYVNKTQAYGALPASFGTPDVPVTDKTPLIWLRKV